MTKIEGVEQEFLAPKQKICKNRAYFDIMIRNLQQHMNGILLGLCAAVTFAGCEQAPEEEGNTPEVPHIEQEKQTGDPLVVSQDAVFLSAKDFSGKIALSRENIENTEKGFSLPVYLQEITHNDFVDTVTLKMNLPTGVRLESVQASNGFTAQIDGIKGAEPTVYYHPFALSAESYEPVTATEDPAFILFFVGAPGETLGLQGSFFRTDGSLLKTKKQGLAL